MKERIRVEKDIPPKSDDDEDEVEVKHWRLSKDVLLGAVETNAELGIQIKAKGKDKWNCLPGWRFRSLLGSMEISKLT